MQLKSELSMLAPMFIKKTGESINTNNKNVVASRKFLDSIYCNKLIDSAVDEVQANKQTNKIDKIRISE